MQGIRYETQLEEDKIQFVIYSWYQGRRIEMIAQNGCAHLVITVEYIWTSHDERHPSLLFSSPLLPFYFLVTFIK